MLDSIAIIVLGNPAPAILFGSMSEALDLTPTRLDARMHSCRGPHSKAPSTFVIFMIPAKYSIPTELSPV